MSYWTDCRTKENNKTDFLNWSELFIFSDLKQNSSESYGCYSFAIYRVNLWGFSAARFSNDFWKEMFMFHN